MYPDDRQYTRDHEWVRVADGEAAVGITDFAQRQLGDVVFVELPEVGARVEAGAPFGTIESVKAVSDLYAPVSGEITEVNDELVDRPEIVNEDPHGAAWMVKIKFDDPGKVDGLLTAAAYKSHIQE